MEQSFFVLNLEQLVVPKDEIRWINFWQQDGCASFYSHYCDLADVHILSLSLNTSAKLLSFQ